MEKEIVLFEDNGIKLEVPVTPEEETVWLNRAQMAELFDRDVKTIGKHIANTRREELEGQVVVAKFATTTPHGAEGKKMILLPGASEIFINLLRDRRYIRH